MNEINFNELEANAEQAATLLKSMANPHRLMILCLLHDNELSVSDINARVSLSQSALSQHLAKLRQQALVKTRRQSQTIYYSLASDSVKRIIGTLHGIYCCQQPDNPA